MNNAILTMFFTRLQGALRQGELDPGNGPVSHRWHYFKGDLSQVNASPAARLRGGQAADGSDACACVLLTTSSPQTRSSSGAACASSTKACHSEKDGRNGGVVERYLQRYKLRGVQALQVYRQCFLDHRHHLSGCGHALDSRDGQGPVNVRLREPAAWSPDRPQPPLQIEIGSKPL